MIKAAFPQLRVEPMFGEDLDERGRKRVLGDAARAPERLRRAGAGAPVAGAGAGTARIRGCCARAIGLRVFACASPNGYVVMPGGLTRVASAADARVISMQRGGRSKDTWVLAAGPVSTFSLLRRSIGPQELVRAGTNLSSRVVENLFWFGRYCERCDATARLLRVALGRFGDNVPGDDDERARPVIAGAAAPRRHPARGRAPTPTTRSSRPRCAPPSPTKRSPASPAACASSARRLAACASGCRSTTGARSTA